MAMTSLKRRHNCFFKVRFSHNQLEKIQFCQITYFQVANIEDQRALGAKSPQRLAIFEYLLLK